ncbi:hypothetical protein [Ruminiclostridium cellulolyticum]|uniref:Uncharacterized protein n=1 Tax=Ruminiclostridium cellulolyticum (strain ATCC 35319 / DSM 5812 / JCM 6584 / H10) TaxID=394503 RepID=B8I087_RUMCH|nr:hypothetical protein [Ruminiclostridium cellulolyticum]ACL77413.1 hypothetical protein Ccel_3122 [Ruminiclostridium cellulolyticum H10]
MLRFKKVTSLVLVLCILFAFSVQSFAASNEDSSVTTITQNKVADSTQIDEEKVKDVLEQLVKDKSITMDYSEQVTAIVEKYADSSSSNSNAGTIHTNYYNQSTGAVIVYSSMPSPLHGQLMFNKAGWNIIKEVLNLGGGSATVGFAIAAIAGITVTAPVAAIIGGALVIENALVNLQFSLGSEFATITF